MPDSPANRILSRAQRAGDPLDEIRALTGSGDVPPARAAPAANGMTAPPAEEPPADAFDRYLAEVEPHLPDRYRHPGRRAAHPYHGGPAIGLALVVVGLIVAAVMRWMGRL